MSCLALLCGLYLELGAGYVAPTPPPTERMIHAHGPATYWLYDANRTANPMGRVQIGYEADLAPRWRVDLSLRHESWVGTGYDHGQNSAWFAVRWRPGAR